DQACGFWKGTYEELLPFGAEVLLVLVGSSERAEERIKSETGMRPVVGRRIGTSDSIFSDACTAFSDKEKASILKYCKRADPKHPKGHGDCGFVIVFAHKCPNNSLPILYARRRGWEGLFPRYN